MKSKRQEMAAKRRRQKAITTWGLRLAAVVVVVALGFTYYNATRPPVGEEVPVMDDFSHVAEGTDPGPYNTDPPSSGRHYAASWPAGFFRAGDIPGPHPEGYLVHSLEHGYVIFWYNCDSLTDQQCQILEGQIQSVMASANNYKVIAYPWESIEEPVVMTSWGRMLRFERFDEDQALEFVTRNREKSPEPLGQ
jgi:hypothetical protein